MHSELCPVCNGKGRVPNPDDVTAPSEVICNGCGGLGYILVPDEYPYYPWYPCYYRWEYWI